MTRRLSVVLIVLAFACLVSLSPAGAESVTLTLTPVPLSDTVVSGFLSDFFLNWDPVDNLGGTLAGSAAGGGAYSQDGDVITFLNNHPEYTDAFPPLALFVGLACQYFWGSPYQVAV
jgi:hypothetical protein